MHPLRIYRYMLQRPACAARAYDKEAPANLTEGGGSGILVCTRCCKFFYEYADEPLGLRNRAVFVTICWERLRFVRSHVFVLFSEKEFSNNE